MKYIIQNTLNQFPSIKLAIVFGSVADNRETVSSDIDLAVLTDTHIDAKQKTQIIEALATATGRAIDLIDLRTAGQPILGQIITRGVRIMGSDTDYAQLITKNLFDQADFLPYRNRILDERREAWIGK
jgi:predicted nucleotidyltransferase